MRLRQSVSTTVDPNEIGIRNQTLPECSVRVSVNWRGQVRFYADTPFKPEADIRSAIAIARSMLDAVEQAYNAAD